MVANQPIITNPVIEQSGLMALRTVNLKWASSGMACEPRFRF